ncbi:hypothetical protein [Actinophytocola sp.]|uniref:hypothetical protein n=1 Tax=Actinophytocola sp. TaxID=1872138 RepID=UPI002ED028FB
MPYPTQPPVVGRSRRFSSRSGLSGLLGVIVVCAGLALLGWWLVPTLGGGPDLPWWLIVGLTVCYGLGISFEFVDLNEPGVVLIYVIWVPAAAWLAARALVNYTFPTLFAPQGLWFVITFVGAMLIGAGVLVKAFRSR